MERPQISLLAAAVAAAFACRASERETDPNGLVLVVGVGARAGEAPEWALIK